MSCLTIRVHPMSCLTIRVHSKSCLTIQEHQGLLWPPAWGVTQTGHELFSYPIKLLQGITGAHAKLQPTTCMVLSPPQRLSQLQEPGHTPTFVQQGQ